MSEGIRSMIHFVAPRGREAGILEYLDSIGHGLRSRMTVMRYEEMLSAAALPAGTYVLSALDQLDAAGRGLLAEVCTQLSASREGVRFLNSPVDSLRRHDLLDLLHRRGINRHRAVHATDPVDDLRYPVFIREEHGHEGSLSPLLHNPAAVSSELGLLVARGFRLGDLRVLEYCDTAGPDGVFRAYGAFVVGSAVVPQFLSRGRRWMLKQSGTEFSEDMLREEYEYVTSNPHRDVLRRVFALARVEYGRVDYAIKDGAVEVWEINLNPTVGWHYLSERDGVPDALRPAREATRQHFAREFQAAFEAVDLPVPPSMIPIHLDRARLPAWGLRQGAGARNAKGGRVRHLLSPFKPLIFRIARLAAPMLVWAGRIGRRLRR